MDLFKAQIDRIQKQLAGLTASQKMLTATLVAIMVMTLVWWGRYAGEAEMEPVLDQSFTQDDIARVTTELTAHGIRYSVSGDRILVSADRKIEALAALSYSHALPRNNTVGFDEMITKMSPWDPVDKSQMMFNRAKEITLAQIIRNFPQVTGAEVMIDPRSERHIEGAIEPTATITLATADTSGGQKLVDAAADVVQGAVSGLSRAKIKVVVNGAPARLHDPDSEDSISAAGNDQIELMQKNELRLSTKIKDNFAYISGLMVSVTVKLNTTAAVEHTTQIDPKGVVQKEISSDTETNESNSGAPSGGEPGVGSNVAVSIAGSAPAGGSGSTTSQERSNVKFENFVSKTDKSSKILPGDCTVIGATVRVPTSYFAMIFEHENGTTKEPTLKELLPLIDEELPKIRTDVLKCTGLQSDKDVSVEPYPDYTPVTNTAVAQVSPLSLSSIGGHSKEIALGGLAVMSLFMVSMMVRKGSVVPALAPAAPIAGPAPTLMNGEAVAGEAAEGGAMLDGMELDEEAVRSQQMLEQVSTMVKENPDAAATLVKRWLNRT